MNEVQALAKRVMYTSFAGWVLMVIITQRLPEPDDISPALYTAPLQESTTPNEFHFPYKGQDIRVVPLQTYEIHGLVVSHNDPAKWYNFDITHDHLSLDTRDICLVWGENLKSGEYRKVSYTNDDWACKWSYGADIAQFNDHEISNNHLITA
ncbi:MAG: hypothetical protein K2Q01_06750, partial [Rickettsiales bacterium]|nr:hypothetical protein [Rickettsiales bacterium]